jgi:hypothetical protein
MPRQTLTKEKTDANLKEMKAGQEHLKEEMLAKLDAHHERMMARMDSQLEKMETTVDVFEERLTKWAQRIWRPIKKS